MDVFELAKQYYPRLWDRARIQALADAGKLTEEQICLLYTSDAADD